MKKPCSKKSPCSLTNASPTTLSTALRYKWRCKTKKVQQYFGITATGKYNDAVANEVRQWKHNEGYAQVNGKLNPTAWADMFGCND